MIGNSQHRRALPTARDRDNPAYPIPASRRRAEAAAQSPARVPTYTQDELRERRRKYLSHVYTGAFDLSAEVEAICDPLARRVAARPRPAAHRREVDDLADAVHELVSTVVGWLAEADARGKTEHLDADKRGRSMRLLRDLAQRPASPEIDGNMLVDGSWSASLIAMTEPYTTPLADLLARAFPPNSSALRGRESSSELLEAALREVDRAARELAYRLDRAEAQPPGTVTPTKTEAVRAELAKMGVQL